MKGADLAPWAVADAGDVYQFPRNVACEIFYCTVEGVAFLGSALP